MGALPPAGQWTRLEVPASLLGLDGATVMGFTIMVTDGALTFDRIGTIASSDTANGETTSYLHDADNRLIAAQDPAEAAAGTDTQYGYDAAGNEISMIDALGNVTTYAYDARNELIGVTDPANQGTTHQYSYTYDPNGNLRTATDPRGNTTTYSYDSDDRLASVQIASGETSTYLYNNIGEVTTFTDGNFRNTNYAYDALGQLQSMTQENSDLEPATTTYAHDPDGNVTAVTVLDDDDPDDPLDATTTYTYDPADRLEAVTDAIGHTTAYTYDGDGNLTSVTDALGHETTYAYDAEDRLVGETEPSGGETGPNDGGTTTYTYDKFGNLLTVTDPDGNTTTYTYDLDNRQLSETSPTAGVTSYTYDAAGNLVQTIDPDGHMLTYSYDADNRETGETWVNPLGGAPLDVFSTTYDSAGNVTSTGDESSNITYTYDSDNRLLTETVTDPSESDVPVVTLSYAYDGVGNTSTLTDSLGGLVSYSYDARNHVSGISQSWTDEAAASVAYTYDDAGNMTALSRASDLYGEDAVLSTTYTYDAANNLVGISNQLPDGTPVSSYAYGLDAADRLSTETKLWTNADGTTSSDTSTYDYTNNNQLTDVSHTNTSFSPETFTYDANGNRTMAGYSTGTGNELTSDGTYNYTYDANGNMVTQTDIATGDETIYTYDYRNRLVEVQQDSGGGPTVVARYTYDALNRRLGVSEAASTTWTIYDGASTDPLIDFDGSGDVTARYLNGPSPAGVDAVLARYTPSGGTAWYLADRLGSVGDIVTNSGMVIDHIDYTAFGTPTQTAPSEGDRFEYAGMQYDAVIGQYYDEARWYRAGTGRFSRLDPMGFGGGDSNLYRYADNDPSNEIDPDGLSLASNATFLWDWFWGNGDRVRTYDPDSPQGRDMITSPGANRLRNAFYEGGCKSIPRHKFSYGTAEGAWDTLLNPFMWGSTALQVGGFEAIAKNNGDGTVTYTISNIAGKYSFFYHQVPDRTSNFGMMTNILQTFRWTEPIDPSKCSPRGGFNTWYQNMGNIGAPMGR
jgi:RHS repeat-associated protein